jgi:geranylgeranyl diphosphate synthase type II
VAKQEVLPFALALEMLHTYSLIHDDLPAMDDDDFRRGKASNHKVFGEANAILAGDGLLNEAYAICFHESMKGEKYARASAFLNECAGVNGMIAGQSADLYFSKQGTEVSEEDLLYIYAHKTGKLLLAPVVIASILKNNKKPQKMRFFCVFFAIF